MLSRTIPLFALAFSAPLARAQEPKPAPNPPAIKPDAAVASPIPATTPALTPLAHIEERGTGPIPLILIPGLACDWRVFDAFMDRNKDRYRMFAVTLPGFGGSAPPPLKADGPGAALRDNAWLNNAYAAVLALIAERKLDRPIIVGHSMGGHLALRFATRAADKVRGVIALDALPLYPPRVTEPDEEETPQRRATQVQSMYEVFQIIPPENWAQQQRSSLPSMVKDPARAKFLGEMCAKVPRDTTVRYMCEMMIADLRPELKNASVPVLVISALALEPSMDAAVATQYLERAKASVASQFADAPKSVQIVYFEDTRHFVMDDRPEELDRAVAAFVKGDKAEGYKSKPAEPPKDLGSDR